MYLRDSTVVIETSDQCGKFLMQLDLGDPVLCVFLCTIDQEMGCQADNGTKESVSVNMSAADPKWIEWWGHFMLMPCHCC
jgi:hypothetical protein